MQKANIEVAVRLRPVLDDERRRGSVSSKLQLDHEQRSVVVYNEKLKAYKSFRFD